MTDEWTTLTDEQLAEVAHRDLQGQGAPVEAMRRLRIAIENLSVSSDNYARRMRRWTRRWTAAIVFLTLIQVMAAAAAIIAAFPIIKEWLYLVTLAWPQAVARFL